MPLKVTPAKGVKKLTPFFFLRTVPDKGREYSHTEKGLWLARAKAAIYKSPKARYNMTEILLELEDANCKKDLKKIIRIYNRYK